MGYYKFDKLQISSLYGIFRGAGGLQEGGWKCIDLLLKLSTGN